LHIAPGATLPPPSAADQVRIELDGFTGRWTPSRGQLEWVDAGTYRSLQGPLELDALVAIAVSLAGGAA
jgi:hypothetical protein